MATFADTTVDALDESSADVRHAGVPAWPLKAVLFSSICIAAGLLWDLSWHNTIGRETFWNLPHLLEQVAAVVAGLSCASLVLHITFNAGRYQRAESLRLLGFSGPLGAWVTLWGTLVMVIAAPFDDWWHNAYGLDARILSAPHLIMAIGMIAIVVGAVLLLVAAQNRTADEAEARRQGWSFAIAGGILIAVVAVLLTRYASRPNQMHNPRFYQVVACAFPILLVAIARAGRLRLSATAAAAIYMVVIMAMMWILQLVPGRPMLAPIYNPVTHMVPPRFPLLLVVPAFAIDLIVRRSSGRNGWVTAALAGLVFVALLLPLQWYFGDFLLSPSARNFFFAADQWSYTVQPGPWQHRFWGVPTDAAGHRTVAAMIPGLAIAAVLGVMSSRLGMWAGNGMARLSPGRHTLSHPLSPGRAARVVWFHVGARERTRQLR